ncbi:SusD/RagB family nutrient-binding outer membrane lipoprotein [Solitalea sp. MAHUQ-68]|uniref:SusD/RagB family nutrient-binding outer membrane lipoprotein n=1 Tax=Solitalea agri TaxID=2953739 RepID=A0A9X2F4W2_9SPHI|nr:SusD/RagB family nutrient-binding outer membrane lipoprotein [Solitalea agri]MCO4294270.1 SusD/RagB family nutrient-binding outer membrane lipoprotein [Solitalea agri]
MKSKYIKHSLVALGLGMVTASCGNLLDINDDPARLTSNQVTISGLLPTAIQYTANSYWNVGQYGNYYPQYLAGHSGQEKNIDSYTPYGFDNIWETSYLRAMPNLKELIDRAEAQGAPQYAGVAKVLMALNLMQCTDLWGDLPYSEAFKGSAVLMPKYDKQQDIYGVHLKNLLDEAIADLDQAPPASATLKVGASDLIYGGTIAKWKMAAYAVRSRYYLHLGKKDPANYAKAAADAQNAFNDRTGAADLELKYPADRVITWSWYSYIFKTAAASRSARPSKYFVDLMNGSATGVYPGLVDPRISKLVDNGGAATYVGRPVGVLGTDAGAAAANTDLTDKTFYGKQFTVTPLISYAEVQFIKAESLFSTDKAASYAAFLEGIKSSMLKFGVDNASIDAYVNNSLISKGAANLTISDIMLQKYIALFLQMETWTDMRRHQYDPTVYVGLTQPGLNQLGTSWVQRAKYPDNEPGRNVNVPKVGNQAEKIWLFQ